MLKGEENRAENKTVQASPAIWRFFSSIRLALILMLILVVLSLIGTFVIQIPPGLSAADRAWWLTNIAQPQTGFWYPILNIAGLFDVFHSIWFLGSGALLIISIIVCTLNRLRQSHLGTSAFLSKTKKGVSKLENNQFDLSGKYSELKIIALLSGVFKRHHYRIREDRRESETYLTAEKNSLSYWGTYFVHLSLILFIAGFLIGSYLGFKDPAFIVPEGITRDIGNNTGLALQLNSFEDEYWPDGSPKDFRSDVIIYKGDQEVQKGVIQINHPLNYEGIRIYQSFFGPAVRARISNTEGQTLYEGNIALDGILENHPFQRPSGGFSLSQEGYVFYFIGRSTNVTDTVLSEGQMGLKVYKTGSNTPVASTKINRGTAYPVDNLQITYVGDAQFSGFEVTRDPGNMLVWIASGLFIIGLISVFYFPRYRLWALVLKDTLNKSQIWMSSYSGRKSVTNPEIVHLVTELKQELSRQKDEQSKET